MVPWGENCDKPLKLKILTLYKTRPIYLSIYYLSLWKLGSLQNIVKRTLSRFSEQNRAEIMIFWKITLFLKIANCSFLILKCNAHKINRKINKSLTCDCKSKLLWGVWPNFCTLPSHNIKKGSQDSFFHLEPFLNSPSINSQFLWLWSTYISQSLSNMFPLLSLKLQWEGERYWYPNLGTKPPQQVIKGTLDVSQHCKGSKVHSSSCHQSIWSLD